MRAWRPIPEFIPARQLSRRAFVSSAAYALTAFALDPWARAFVPSGLEGQLKLNAFHRATQLQAHIPHQGLSSLPDYLKQASKGFLFNRRRPDRTAIPFVDTFTITRFLGGVREDWLKQQDELDPALGRQSLDYVIQDNDGRLRTRPEIVRMHLEPYLQAGYSASDVTIVLDNVPWALARDGGTNGPYGQRNPPSSLENWQWLLGELARDVKRTVVSGAPNFKVGNEFDTKKSFNGNNDDYFALYETCFRLLRREFPESSIAPGEFTGDGHCHVAPQCVYDTADFLTRAKALGIQPDYVPRSLHAFQDQGNTLPSVVVKRAVDSFAPLGQLIPEIHQFGLLGQPFGPFHLFGSEQGSRRAAWEFCVLMRLFGRLRPRRVFHWEPFFALNGTNFSILNGVGFARLLLDQYVGATVQELSFASESSEALETIVILFGVDDVTALVVASFSPVDRKPGRTEIKLPFSKAAHWRCLRTGLESNIFTLIKSDLRKADNLREEFAAREWITAEPTLMASDRPNARQLLLANQKNYEAAALEELRWKQPSDLPYSIRQSGSALIVDLPANEVLVLEIEN